MASCKLTQIATHPLPLPSTTHLIASISRCFPFLLFQFPLIGEALTKCRSTAYDQTGQLVLKLTKFEVATLYEKQDDASRTVSPSPPTEAMTGELEEGYGTPPDGARKGAFR